MKGGREYDIFPRTFNARLLLLVAFLGGLCLVTGYFALLVFETNTPQVECRGSERRICFVPLGQVDPDLVASLVNYYHDEYGLDIRVLKPSAVPADLTNPNRGQIDGEALANYMGKRFPADFRDPNAILIGLTPLDLYAADEDWIFELGVASWSAKCRGVVSTYRMHWATSGLANNEVVLLRTRKMVTKYIGLMYYRLPPSDDPTSPMYGHIMAVTDLDNMQEPLPVLTRPRVAAGTSPGPG